LYCIVFIINIKKKLHKIAYTKFIGYFEKLIINIKIKMDLHLTDETSPISKKRKQDQLSTSEFNVGNKLLRIQYGRQSVQGMRSEMEDADKALVDVTKDKIESDNNRFSFFGVYDGHGGKKASEYLATRFHNILREEKKIKD